MSGDLLKNLYLINWIAVCKVLMFHAILHYTQHCCMQLNLNATSLHLKKILQSFSCSFTDISIIFFHIQNNTPMVCMINECQFECNEKIFLTLTIYKKDCKSNDCSHSFNKRR